MSVPVTSGKAQTEYNTSALPSKPDIAGHGGRSEKGPIPDSYTATIQKVAQGPICRRLHASVDTRGGR